MFRGEYEHTIDAKGRIIIPAKLRDALGEQFIVTKGLDGCLFVYPMEQWAIFEEKLQALPLNQPSAVLLPGFFSPVLRSVSWTSRDVSCCRLICGNMVI